MTKKLFFFGLAMVSLMSCGSMDDSELHKRNNRSPDEVRFRHFEKLDRKVISLNREKVFGKPAVNIAVFGHGPKMKYVSTKE